MAFTESDKKYLKNLVQENNVHPIVFLQNNRPESGLFTDFLKTCQELVPQLAVATEVIPDTELPD